MIKIEKDKPVPTPGRPNIYPFMRMEIGDSFFVPLNGRVKSHVTNSILGAGRSHRWEGRKFTTRYIRDEDGIRCWRIE